MGGWQEEVFYSRYRSAMCLEWLGRPAAEAREAYEECFREHPHRAEPLVRAAALARKNEDFFDAYVLAKRAAQVPKPASALFVQSADYEYRAKDELAIAAYYCDFPQEAFDLATELLDNAELPDSARARIEANRDYAVPRLKDEFLRYDAELVARIAAREPRANPRVTLSITSCRRLPLFIGTVDPSSTPAPISIWSTASSVSMTAPARRTGRRCSAAFPSSNSSGRGRRIRVMRAA